MVLSVPMRSQEFAAMVFISRDSRWLAATGQVQRDHQAAREVGGTLEEFASIEAHVDLYTVLQYCDQRPDFSCAARWIAARMR